MSRPLDPRKIEDIVDALDDDRPDALSAAYAALVAVGEVFAAAPTAENALDLARHQLRVASLVRLEAAAAGAGMVEAARRYRQALEAEPAAHHTERTEVVLDQVGRLVRSLQRHLQRARVEVLMSCVGTSYASGAGWVPDTIADDLSL